MCVMCVPGATGDQEILWNEIHWWSLANTWVLRTDSGFSARVARALNHETISPAPQFNVCSYICVCMHMYVEYMHVYVLMCI